MSKTIGFRGVLANMESYVKTLHHTTKRGIKTNLKMKKQPELPDYKTAWKSDNQGVKEETFFQTSSRGREGIVGLRGCSARQQLVDQARWQLTDRISHIPVLISWEEQLGSQTNCTPQGSSMGKASIKTSGCKNL